MLEVLAQTFLIGAPAPSDADTLWPFALATVAVAVSILRRRAD